MPLPRIHFSFPLGVLPVGLHEIHVDRVQHVKDVPHLVEHRRVPPSHQRVIKMEISHFTRKDVQATRGVAAVRIRVHAGFNLYEQGVGDSVNLLAQGVLRHDARRERSAPDITSAYHR